MLKSMHAEEDAKYTESRSLSLVRSFVRSSKGHFLTAPLTPSRFLTSVGEQGRRCRPAAVGVGRDGGDHFTEIHTGE